MMRSENLLIGELTIEVTRKKNLKADYSKWDKLPCFFEVSL